MTHIIYRTCENIHPINGTRPEWCREKSFKIKCLKSLVLGLQDQDYKFIVIGDKLSEDSINKIKNIVPNAEIQNFSEGLGNQKSLLKSYAAADNISNDKDIIFFCEDDYIYLPQWHRNMNHFFANIGIKFNDSFYHPTDYPDQYRDDRIRKNFIFVNKYGGWFREVDSTTCTKACSVKTYRKYADLMKDCAVKKKIGYDVNANPVYDDSGADDGRLSEIFGHKNAAGYIKLNQTAVCFSPLPGDAAHLHIGTESYFINWKDVYNKITNEYFTD